MCVPLTLSTVHLQMSPEEDFICIYIYICIYTYIHMYIYKCMCTSHPIICTCALKKTECLYKYIFMHIHVYTYINMCTSHPINSISLHEH